GRHGFVVAITGIESVGKGLIRDGTGFATFPVKYQCVVFRPFKGEILEAVVTMVNKMGFFPEVGPVQIYSNPTPSATQTVGVGNTAVSEGDGADTHFQKKKRAKKSVVWLEFTEETINGQLKALCNHCFICTEMKIPGEFFMTE
ncbi:hypothetical protein Tsubulata_008666, partial [Turnera subulata]